MTHMHTEDSAQKTARGVQRLPAQTACHTTPLRRNSHDRQTHRNGKQAGGCLQQGVTTRFRKETALRVVTFVNMLKTTEPDTLKRLVS